MAFIVLWQSYFALNKGNFWSFWIQSSFLIQLSLYPYHCFYRCIAVYRCMANVYWSTNLSLVMFVMQHYLSLEYLGRCRFRHPLQKDGKGVLCWLEFSDQLSCKLNQVLQLSAFQVQADNPLSMCRGSQSLWPSACWLHFAVKIVLTKLNHLSMD